MRRGVIRLGDQIKDMWFKDISSRLPPTLPVSYIIFKDDNGMYHGKTTNVEAKEFISTDLGELFYLIFDHWYNRVQKRGVESLSIALTSGTYNMNTPFIISEWNSISDKPYTFELIGFGKPMIICYHAPCIAIRSTGVAPYWVGGVTLARLWIAPKTYDWHFVIDLVQTSRTILYDLDISPWPVNGPPPVASLRVVQTGAGDHGTWIDRIRIDEADQIGMVFNHDPVYTGHISLADIRRIYLFGSLAYNDWLLILNEDRGTSYGYKSIPPIEVYGLSSRYVRREYVPGYQRDKFIWIHTAGGFAGVGIDTLWDNDDSEARGYKIVDGSLYRGAVSRLISYVKVRIGYHVGNYGYKKEIYDFGPNASPLLLSAYISGVKQMEVQKGGVLKLSGVVPITSGVVSVPAGGSYVVARFTVPSDKTLYIYQIAELFDPDGYISAEVYNVTDAVSVVTVDGIQTGEWSVAGGKTVEFRLKNSDTVNPHSGNYAFLISIG